MKGEVINSKVKAFGGGAIEVKFEDGSVETFKVKTTEVYLFPKFSQVLKTGKDIRPAGAPPSPFGMK